MADKPLTTSPMYPGVEYVRVRQDGVEFTTAQTSVTKDMTVLKDADAISRVTGLPLDATSADSSTGKESARHKAASSTSSSGTAAASTQPEEG